MNDRESEYFQERSESANRPLRTPAEKAQALRRAAIRREAPPTDKGVPLSRRVA